MTWDHHYFWVNVAVCAWLLAICARMNWNVSSGPVCFAIMTQPETYILSENGKTQGEAGNIPSDPVPKRFTNHPPPLAQPLPFAPVWLWCLLEEVATDPTNNTFLKVVLEGAISGLPLRPDWSPIPPPDLPAFDPTWTQFGLELSHYRSKSGRHEVVEGLRRLWGYRGRSCSSQGSLELMVRFPLPHSCMICFPPPFPPVSEPRGLGPVELCVLFGLFLGKSPTKYSQNPGFKPIFGHSAGITKSVRPHRKQCRLWPYDFLAFSKEMLAPQRCRSSRSGCPSKNLQPKQGDCLWPSLLSWWTFPRIPVRPPTPARDDFPSEFGWEEEILTKETWFSSLS